MFPKGYTRILLQMHTNFEGKNASMVLVLFVNFNLLIAN